MVALIIIYLRKRYYFLGCIGGKQSFQSILFGFPHYINFYSIDQGLNVESLLLPGIPIPFMCSGIEKMTTE